MQWTLSDLTFESLKMVRVGQNVKNVNEDYKFWGSYSSVDEDSGLLRHDTVWLDECFLTFWQRLIALSAGVRQFKKNDLWLADPWRRQHCIPLKHDYPLTQQHTVPESSINVLYLMALIYLIFSESVMTMNTNTKQIMTFVSSRFLYM